MVTVSLTYVPLLLPLTGFFLGLIVGSFANVVIHRIPKGHSIITGRSKCVNCDKKLAWYDLIPIVSFFLLKFRCRQCHKPISWLYPVVELYSGIIFLLAYYYFANQALVPPHYSLLTTHYSLLINWLFAVFILESLLILALIDFKNLILPNSVMLVMFLGVLIYGVWERWTGDYWFNIFSFNNLIGTVILFSVLFLLWSLSKGAWLGLGDSKLAGLIGLIFGLWGGLVIIYGAVIVGTIAGSILLISHRANLKTKLPLGTFICFSATAYVFFGMPVQNWLAEFFYVVPLILK